MKPTFPHYRFGPFANHGFKKPAVRGLASVLCAAGLLFLTQPSSAQTTISGQIDLTVSEMVQISGLNDMLLEPYTVTTTVPAIWYNWEPFCVYANSASGQFELTTTGSGPAGAYQIENGNGDTMSYRAYFYTPSEGVTEMFTGVTQTVSDAHQTRADCGGATTTWFAPSFQKTDVDSAQAGTVYNGTVFFTVAPI